MSRPFLKRTNVVILGKQGVGKTTIFNHLQGCIESKCPTVTKRRVNQVEVKNDDAHIIVSDINLSTIQNRGCPFSVCKADVVILVYSVDDLDSFEYVESLKDFFLRRNGSEFPIIVIGNKTDLSNRAMQYDVVDCVVNIDWGLTYTEFSALNGNTAPKSIASLFTKSNQKQLITIGKHLSLFDAESTHSEINPRLQKNTSTSVFKCRSWSF